jgi:hypothetical protein
VPASGPATSSTDRYQIHYSTIFHGDIFCCYTQGILLSAERLSSILNQRLQEYSPALSASHLPTYSAAADEATGNQYFGKRPAMRVLLCATFGRIWPLLVSLVDGWLGAHRSMVAPPPPVLNKKRVRS